MQQVNRKYVLQIGGVEDGLTISNLQVTFDISKSSNNTEKTNSASIEIYNLSAESLKVLDIDYPYAVFSVGYGGLNGLTPNVKRVFAGQVTNVTTRRRGTDRVTQILMGDGYVELNHTVMSKLVAPGRTVKDVAEDIRKAIPNVSRGVYNGTNINSSLIYGYPLQGTPRDMLDELSKKYNLEWQLNDGDLYVHDKGRANDENFSDAFVISRNSGLIENAYRASGDRRKSEKDEDKKQAVQWTQLLNPELVPGSIVKLEDTFIEGWYKLTEVRHSGGWRDAAWHTECRAVAIEKVVSK